MADHNYNPCEYFSSETQYKVICFFKTLAPPLKSITVFNPVNVTSKVQNITTTYSPQGIY